MDKNPESTDSVYKLKAGTDGVRTAWTPSVIFRVNARSESDTPTNLIPLGPAYAASNLVYGAGAAAMGHTSSLLTGGPGPVLMSSSTLVNANPQLTIHSTHAARAPVDESHAGSGLGVGRGHKSSTKVRLPNRFIAEMKS
jgi:hypothetical protein